MSKSVLNKKKDQLDSLVLLRGIAVVLVCLCHFGKPLSEGNFFASTFKWFDHYGEYGVHIFFVISGFVIPLSLYKGKYILNDYFRFIYKRILRLHPPYLAALVFTLIVMFFSYKVRGVEFPEDSFTILKGLVYLHIPADNPVFWTLIVEAQYYLFIGLFYIIIIRYHTLALTLAIPLLLLLSNSSIVEYISLFSYIVFFLIGTVGFLLYTNYKSVKINFITLSFLLIYTAIFYEIAALIFSSLTIAFILLSRRSFPKIIQFPGKISYAIYLIHFPLGIKLINFIKPYIDPAYTLLLFIFTMLVVLTSSWLFYKIFEEYSENLSRKIKYNSNTNSNEESIQDEQIVVRA